MTAQALCPVCVGTGHLSPGCGALTPDDYGRECHRCGGTGRTEQAFCRYDDRHPTTGRFLAYDCEVDCQAACWGACGEVGDPRDRGVVTLPRG